MTFYLGTDHPHWLYHSRIPLFISRRSLARRGQRWRRGRCRWALDSGGFTELSTYGEWRTSARQYAEEARRWKAEIGRLDWAAIQDWMCEPSILEKTRSTVRGHQARSIRSYLELRGLAPDVDWLPVLQGWRLGDYERHADAYERAGVNLAGLPLVGVGSICRRQSTREAEEIIRTLARRGIPIHAFGVKMTGLRRFRDAIRSADSMAWSYNARRNAPRPGCTHRRCNHCMTFALEWRRRALR